MYLILLWGELAGGASSGTFASVKLAVAGLVPGLCLEVVDSLVLLSLQ